MLVDHDEWAKHGCKPIPSNTKPTRVTLPSATRGRHVVGFICMLRLPFGCRMSRAVGFGVSTTLFSRKRLQLELGRKTSSAIITCGGCVQRAQPSVPASTPPQTAKLSAARRPRELAETTLGRCLTAAALYYAMLMFSPSSSAHNDRVPPTNASVVSGIGATEGPPAQALGTKFPTRSWAGPPRLSLPELVRNDC